MPSLTVGGPRVGRSWRSELYNRQVRTWWTESGGRLSGRDRMKALALPKSLLIRQPWEYRKVYQVGKRLRSPRLTIIYLANGGTDSRLGISIHGIKTAVRRNRIKRIIREFFRLNRHFITPSADVVFAVRPGFEQDSPQEVKQLVERMLLGTRAGSGRRQPGGTGSQSPLVVLGPLGVPE